MVRSFALVQGKAMRDIWLLSCVDAYEPRQNKATSVLHQYNHQTSSSLKIHLGKRVFEWHYMGYLTMGYTLNNVVWGCQEMADKIMAEGEIILFSDKAMCCLLSFFFLV